MNVVNHLPGFEAPIVGLIQDTFEKGKGKGIGSYADKIDNGVKLEPIFDDILGEHSREALQAFGTQLDEFSAEARGLLTNRTTQAKLPLRSMWLKDVPYSEADNKSNTPAPSIIGWQGNNSQKQAVRKSFGHLVPLVWRPAATGKSETMAKIILERIIRDAKQRCLVVAPRNVPVDSLLRRCHAMWVARFPDPQKAPPAPFMRLYSHTQTRAQYAIKAAMLNAPYHIDRLRLGEAQKAKEQFKSFLNGRQDYLDSGVIEDEDLGKKYLVGVQAADSIRHG